MDQLNQLKMLLSCRILLKLKGTNLSCEEEKIISLSLLIYSKYELILNLTLILFNNTETTGQIRVHENKNIVSLTIA